MGGRGRGEREGGWEGWGYLSKFKLIEEEHRCSMSRTRQVCQVVCKCVSVSALHGPGFRSKPGPGLYIILRAGPGPSVSGPGRAWT